MSDDSLGTRSDSELVWTTTYNSDAAVGMESDSVYRSSCCL